MVVLGTLGGVHQLNGEIDPLGRTVGAGQGHDVFFAQDRHLALDEQPRALIDIGDDAIADDHALAGFHFDFESHPGLQFRVLPVPPNLAERR